MADINGKRIISTASSPEVFYDITYTKSRPDNSHMKYVFTIKTILENQYSFIYTGHNLTATITVNGVSDSAVIKTRDESWGEAAAGTVRSTDTITITCNSTSTAVQTVTFKVVNTYGDVGNVTNSSYTVAPTAPAPSYTKCGAPTWKSGAGSEFYGTLAGGNGNVTVTWDEGTPGTNNSVTGYIIQAKYPDDDWYEKWNSSGTSATLNFEGLSGQNCTIQLRIMTKGSAGSSYYSDWSSTISVTALGRSKCTAPTSVTIRSSASASSSEIEQKDCGSGAFYIHWNAGKAGLNNSISGYTVYRRNKTSGQTTWSVFKTVTGTSTLYVSDNLSESNDYEYCVVTNGSGGSSWGSEYSGSKMIRMRVTSPTGVSITARTEPRQTNSVTLDSVTHFKYGAVLLASWSPDPSKNLYVNVTPSGGVGVKYYRVWCGCYLVTENPLGHETPGGTTSGVTGWYQIVSTLAPGIAFGDAQARRDAGQAIVYRVDAVGNNGLTSSSYYYSVPIITSGTLRFKTSGSWDHIAIPYIKVSGTYRKPVQVWIKVSGTWRKSF